MIEIKCKYDGIILYTAENALDLKGALQEAVAKKANLQGADLHGADLRGADLRGARLCSANLRGADLWRADLYGASLCVSDLRGAYLHDVSLGGGADLGGAKLCGADLSGANLYGASLRGADLHESRLWGADLSEATLRDANLQGVSLRGVNLYEVDLRGVDLSGVKDWDMSPDPKLPKKVAKKLLKAPKKNLDIDSWYTCEATRYLTGWVVHLSGPAGYALKAIVGARTASQILMPSAAHLFHASDEEIINEEIVKWAKAIVAGDTTGDKNE